jgi:hypothetical protein
MMLEGNPMKFAVFWSLKPEVTREDEAELVGDLLVTLPEEVGVVESVLWFGQG